MKPSNERNQLARYQLLVQHREYIDRVFWSRIQVLHLIQAGVIAGSFYVRPEHCGGYPILSFIILVLGIILTIILRIMAGHDWDDATVNNMTLYHLGDTLEIRWGAERKKTFGLEIKGHQLFLNLVFPLFLVVDLSLLLYFVFDC